MFIYSLPQEKVYLFSIISKVINSKFLLLKNWFWMKVLLALKAGSKRHRSFIWNLEISSKKSCPFGVTWLRCHKPWVLASSFGRWDYQIADFWSPCWQWWGLDSMPFFNYCTPSLFSTMYSILPPQYKLYIATSHHDVLLLLEITRIWHFFSVFHHMV